MSSAVEVREVNDVDVSGSGRQTVGGRYVFHHMIWGTRVMKAQDGSEDDPTLARLIGGDGRRGRSTKLAATPISSASTQRGC